MYGHIWMCERVRSPRSAGSTKITKATAATSVISGRTSRVLGDNVDRSARQQTIEKESNHTKCA